MMPSSRTTGLTHFLLLVLSVVVFDLRGSRAFLIPEKATVGGLRGNEELSAFTSTTTSKTTGSRDDESTLSSLYCSSSSILRLPRRRREEEASSVWTTQSRSWMPALNLSPVWSAAFLITSNTVGAGCLVLPELAQGPGLAPSAGIFGAVYLVNLLSGLIVAEVSIQQHEQRQLKIETTEADRIATAGGSRMEQSTALVSLFVNGCVQAFDVSRAGVLAATYCHMDPSVGSCIWATVAASLIATQSTEQVSQWASLCVTTLLVSFLGLWVPGMAAVHDPLGTFLSPGTAPVFWDSVWEAAPVMLMAMIYQNIVPTVVQLLQYDRKQITQAVSLGSLLPLILYIGWCFASLGGSSTTNIMSESPFSQLLMIGFSVSALAGSTLGSSLSLVREMKQQGKQWLESSTLNDPHTTNSMETTTKKTLSTRDYSMNEKVDDKNSIRAAMIPHWTASLLSNGVPLSAALLFSHGSGFTGALQLAGSYGSPLLYGVLPVLVLWQLQHSPKEDNKSAAKLSPSSPMLVHPVAVPLLGTLSMGFLGQEFVEQLHDTLAALA